MVLVKIYVIYRDKDILNDRKGIEEHKRAREEHNHGCGDWHSNYLQDLPENC